MRKTRILFITVFLLAALLTAGMAVHVDMASAQRLTIARPSDALSLDSMLDTTAVGAWVYVNMLEPLLRLNTDMELEPILAERWDVIDDVRIRFYLREGIKFHDGEPFNADAVVYNFERFLDSDPPARWKPLAGPLAGAEKIDEYTVDVLTTMPYGPVLRALAMPYVHMVSPKAAQEMGEDFGRQPVGTGPFMFKEWVTDDRIVIERFDDYWGENAKLQEVIFRVMPEESVRMMALRTGEVDMVLKPAPAEVDIFRLDPDFDVHEVLGLRTVYTSFGLEHEYVDDPRVRRAIAHAIDVDMILAHILEGAAAEGEGYISPGVFGFHDTGLREKYRYDPDEARRLLGDYGYNRLDNQGFLINEDGERLVLEFMGYRGRFLKDGEIIEAIQDQLRRVGIDLRVEFLEWAAAFERLRSGDVPHMTLMGWVTTNADADYSLYGLFHSKEWAPAGWNRFKYANPRVDVLLEKARTSLDQEERYHLYTEIHTILVDDTVLIPIYNTIEAAITTKDLRGLQMHPVEYNLFLQDVYFD